jgi:hypothetical protein
MSGCRPTNSGASARIRLMSSLPQRRSILTLRPSVQPKSASACVNAETRASSTGSFSSPDTNTPIRRTRSPCCALATAGQAAALPSPAMNCRRRIRSPLVVREHSLAPIQRILGIGASTASVSRLDHRRVGSSVLCWCAPGCRPSWGHQVSGLLTRPYAPSGDLSGLLTRPYAPSGDLSGLLTRHQPAIGRHRLTPVSTRGFLWIAGILGIGCRA